MYISISKTLYAKSIIMKIDHVSLIGKAQTILDIERKVFYAQTFGCHSLSYHVPSSTSLQLGKLCVTVGVGITNNLPR